jgi:hypothetical protein
MTPWVEDDDPRTFDKCRDCKGTSWVLYRCERGDQVSRRDDKLPRKVCDRPQTHPAHTYADRCACAVKPTVKPYQEVA